MGKTYKKDDPNRPRKAGKHSRSGGRNQGHVERRQEEKATDMPRGGWRDRSTGQDWTREEIRECRNITGTHPRDLDDNPRRKALGIVRKVLMVEAEQEAARERKIRADEEYLFRAYSHEASVGQDRANMVLRLRGRHIGALTAQERLSALERAERALQGLQDGPAPLARPDLVVYSTDERLYQG